MAAVSARCVVEVVGGSKIETRLTRARLSNMGIQYTQYRSHESEYRITPAQVGFLVRFPIRIDVIQFTLVQSPFKLTYRFTISPFQYMLPTSTLDYYLP